MLTFGAGNTVNEIFAVSGHSFRLAMTPYVNFLFSALFTVNISLVTVVSFVVELVNHSVHFVIVAPVDTLAVNVTSSFGQTSLLFAVIDIDGRGFTSMRIVVSAVHVALF